MGDAARKDDRLYIPQRDKTIIAKAKPSLSNHCSHQDQVMNAFALFFSKYNEAMKDLSKV